jgi:hypothetical protein
VSGLVGLDAFAYLALDIGYCIFAAEWISPQFKMTRLPRVFMMFSRFF